MMGKLLSLVADVVYCKIFEQYGHKPQRVEMGDTIGFNVRAQEVCRVVKHCRRIDVDYNERMLPFH